ncbi:amino acid permease [Sphingosinicella microcystinivorans]|uniref:amino acid permease n=1 Tax=Sphingosinicella microcystinivorans TaxID=335406 RepID=UPI0022F3ECBB|nr:amino acid permease [Sphingosinicella microcystinivorans]WBX86546.1 amino acid permease [Sphingosinicella microcystinivorans]
MFGRRKGLRDWQSYSGSRALRRTLTWPHLVALGVGAIVGTGIYTLIGIGAGKAGPAVIVSFAIAGLVCACAALAYAELATMMPAAGSAYSYSYVALSEPVAWVVGWSLVLEYTVVCAAVAVGWSGYAVGFLNGWGVTIPHEFAAGPHAGGIINLPAILITMAVAGLLALGTRESAFVNTLLVLLKMSALALFIVLAVPAFDPANLEPFAPYGWGSEEVGGNTVGVMAGAALIFFAFYGFDAVSTAAEEAKDPARDLTIGIIGSMLICTVVYMAVAAAAIGAMPVAAFSASGEPLAHVLRSLGWPGAAQLIGAGAIVAMPTVLLAFMYGQSRIFFAIARDGLLPERLAHVNARTGTPVLMTVVTAVVVSIIAGLLPLGEIAELANTGTLAAFTAIGVSLIVLRRRAPDAERRFRVPFYLPVALVAIGGCLYLFVSLPEKTQARFLVWNLIGVAVYLAYGMRRSLIAAVSRKEA